MTSALQYITNIDANFPKPGQDNPSQGFRSNFANIQQALSNLNSYMDGLAATTLNIVAPSITATQTLTVFDKLKIGNTNSVYASIVGYNDLVITGKNSDGTDGAGSVPLFLNVIGVGRVSYGTDGNGSYFVSNTAIDKIIVGATFTNNLLTKFTVTRVDIPNNKIYYTPDSLNNLPATVNITNPPLGGALASFKYTLNSFLPIGCIILWYGTVGTIPTGWRLCDGNSGAPITVGGIDYFIPDLRDRFVVGAGGNYNVASTGGSADAIVVSHTHTGTTGGQSQDHTHKYGSASNWGSSQPNAFDARNTGDFATSGTSNDHTHNFTTNAAGSSGTNANLPPYYALCYIMKIS
jgi:hypothetical protein